MSARFTVTHKDEAFEVEITSDGELVFLDRDIEYEIAFVAMGGDKSPVLLWLDKWQQDPTETICYYFDLGDVTLSLLAADWAEHVLPIFERAYPKDKRPGRAIEAARDFVAGKITAAQLSKARSHAWEAKEIVWSAESWNAAYAATAAWAVSYMASVRADVSASARAATRAAEEQAAERSWQVRHFVHAMECLQAGKKWPKIKETP